jgi:hypothetical protein
MTNHQLRIENYKLKTENDKRSGGLTPAQIWAAVIVLIGLCVGGCRTTPALNTASGRPEVMIYGKSTRQILNVSRDFFIHRGYSLIASDNGNKLRFDRRTEKPGATPSASHCWRVQLTVFDLSNGSHHLTGTSTKVENCGGEMESEQVIRGAFPQIQRLLEEIKGQLDSAR